MLYDSVSRLLVRLQSPSVETKVLLKCSCGLVQHSGYQYAIGKWCTDVLFIPVPESKVRHAWLHLEVRTFGAEVSMFQTHWNQSSVAQST